MNFQNYPAVLNRQTITSLTLKKQQLHAIFPQKENPVMQINIH